MNLWMVVELPIGDIHFAKPPKGGGAVGLSPSGNLPDSKGRVTDSMGSLEGALCFFFLSFLLTSADSLDAFFLTNPLFSLSRKSRDGVGLDGGDFEVGREGWVGAGLLAGGLLADGLLDGGLLGGGFEAGREGWAGADLLAGGLLSDGLLDGGLLRGGFKAGREGWAGDGLLAGGLLAGGLLDGGLLAQRGWVEMGGRDDPKRSTPPTENPWLSCPSSPCGACGNLC